MGNQHWLLLINYYKIYQQRLLTFAKLRARRAFVPYVLYVRTCLTGLRAFLSLLSTCFYFLRGLRASIFVRALGAFSFLRALRVFIFLRVLHALIFTCLTCSHFYTFLRVFIFFRALLALIFFYVPYVPSFFYTLYVPSLFFYLRFFRALYAFISYVLTFYLCIR